jgi:NADH dehydrogenase
MGVEVRLNARVTDIDEGGVWVGGEHLAAQNVIWAAGVAAPRILATLGVPLDRSGRVMVNPDLSVPGHGNVFVLGDAANAKDGKTGKPIPGLAPAAIQAGKYVGNIIRADLGGAPVESREAFHYRDKGVLATIGTRRAVADIRGWRFGGVLAWLMWSLVHITYLIGFRNRLFVMAGWIYDYFAHNREARLITGTYQMRIHTARKPAIQIADACEPQKEVSQRH